MKSPVYLFQGTAFKGSSIKFLLLCILFFIASHLEMKAQDFWEEIILPDTLQPANSDILFDDDGTVYLGTLQGLFKSYDNGLTWYSTGLTEVAALMAMAPDQAIYVITMCGSDPCLCKSNDFGDTWTQIITWDDIPNFSCSFISSDYHLIYGAMGGIYVSVDSGYTWVQELITSNVEVINDIIEHNGVLFGGATNFMSSFGGGVYQSLDNGSTWQQISLPGFGISSFEIDSENNILCGISSEYGIDYGVKQSYDNGYTWHNILVNNIITSLLVDFNGNIYAGCDNAIGPGGIQYSENNGISWSTLNEGLHEDASITYLTVSTNNYVFCETVFPTKLYRSIDPIVKINEYKIHTRKNQGYISSILPNPALYLLTVNYTLRVPCKALFMITSITGQELLSCQEEKNSAGEYTKSMDISDLPEGIYFLAFYLNDRLVGTEKVLLMK